jgi:hypothetical protein
MFPAVLRLERGTAGLQSHPEGKVPMSADDAYLHLRVVEDLRDKTRQQCHIYNESGEKLGVLPVSKVKVVMSYNAGHAVCKLTVICARMDVETFRPRQPRPQGVAR